MLTEKLRSEDRFKAFQDYVESIPFIYPKVAYPSVFGEGLVGVRATEDILPNEPILFVPAQAFITIARARNSSIARIFNAHPALFMRHYDKDYLILTTFIIYEHIKGKESEWYAYLRIMGEADLPYHWSPE